ncbi:Outer membrane cobalamin receptor protein [Chitinophaga ginsengisegetis]|uniref:Outer membrane cobalamin receptor protein n=1 Tax=Chitinophaga ginsengisegetis TaxID=393003 RepID=A0A1T5NGM1_9BACT|nr:TonB-dependent receptor [Chitinophaga ginsengisegetis]SKC99278.1 Outer membrane cobalamin receptor protein [Chitinophaga ginsengisegetis]
MMRFKTPAKAAGMLLLLLCGVVAAFAQQADSVTSKDLREVSVTAPRTAREVSPGQKMQAKELERLGSHSVADAIRFFAGLQVKDYGGIGGLKTVDIRSMGTNQVGVFYDGIQLGNAQNGQVDLGRFSLDNMEEIALYNGQKSNIFQPAKDFGSAGAIYLTSLKPKFAPGEKTHLRGTIKTGSFGLFNPSLLWQQKISSKVSASFSTEWINATGRYKFSYQKRDENGHLVYDTSAYRKNGDINAVRVEGGFNGLLNGGEWSTKVYYYQSERGLPGFIVNGVFGHVDRQWDQNIFVQSSFRKDITKRYSILLNGKYAYDYTRFLAPDTARLYIDNHYRQYEMYFSMAHQYALTNWWTIAASGDFQWNRLDADLTNFSYPTRYTTLTAAATNISFNRFSAQASLLGTFVNETVKKNASAPYQQKFTPAVFVSWQPTHSPDFRLRGFYKQIFRMPTFNDLYYTEIGNRFLKPEFATQYDVGFTWNKTFANSWLTQAGIETNAYYNEVNDKIVAVPGASMLSWQMENLGFVKIKGVDVKAKALWLIKKQVQFSTRLTYTYQRAQDFTDPSDSFYGDQIVYIPRHSGSLILGADYKQWEANYSFIYTGERYNSKENKLKNYVEPWYTSDLSLGKQFSYKHTRFHVTAQVNNLANQFYEVVISYPMPGRNYRFILTVNI